MDTAGAHCQNTNYYSVGICFKGNFEKEKITELQLTAGIEFVNKKLNEAKEKNSSLYWGYYKLVNKIKEK